MEEKTVKFRWLGVVSFEITVGDVHILVDPFITDNPHTELTVGDIEKCDYILVSHGHYDHVQDIPALVKKFQPKILTGVLTAPLLAGWSDSNPSYVYGMNPGLVLDFGDFSVEARFGKHTDQGRFYHDIKERIDNNVFVREDGTEAYRKLNEIGNYEFTNFIIRAFGKTIVTFGNNVRPEQLSQFRDLAPDLALLQLTKEGPEAVMCFAENMKVKLVVPHHMDLKQTREEYLPRVEKLQELGKEKGIGVIEPVYGEWVEI